IPMKVDGRCRIAILYSRGRDAKEMAVNDEGPFSLLFREFARLGAHAEASVYHDDVYEAVKRQLLSVDGVLVWVNPIEGERDRTLLDRLLRDVAARGVFVSAHPDVILKLGTKQVLYDTRQLGWGCDTHVYRSFDALQRELPARLAAGAPRVLKQYRGNGGNGVWKVELAIGVDGGTGDAIALTGDTLVRARHAKRGCVEETMSLGEFFERCAPYFAGEGRMIDQAYQRRLPEGMIRCYLVHDKVAGFGHQAINALYPPPPGAPPEAAPKPSPRLYHPPTLPAFQALRRKLETEWVPAMQRLLDIKTDDLPILWDCDFLLGQQSASGDDSYILCEINVSCVTPFPDSALCAVAEAALAQSRIRRHL
ncbi:MAG: Cj0069 family protein, partial [Burkholderiales bacterium]